jgi:hypothetical protein
LSQLSLRQLYIPVRQKNKKSDASLRKECIGSSAAEASRHQRRRHFDFDFDFDFDFELDFDSDAWAGLPLREVDAIALNSFSLMEAAIDLDGPFNSLLLVSPRLADSAAPAAFCWALDFAGMISLLWLHR